MPRPDGVDSGLAAHPEQTYGVQVQPISTLDKGVYRVDRPDGTPWVARVFPAERGLAAAVGDVAILGGLERAGFPAERCAGPVSVMNTMAVVVTGFVPGHRPPRRARTYAVLGALLGRLHARPATTFRAGGAWHHLCPQGGPREEITAALALLDERGLAADHRLRTVVEQLDDGADLPEAFVHPDFVPANAIASTADSLVIIDWAGSGRGPRLLSYGFLLWAAGATDLRLVDWVASRYRRHVLLEPEELRRLPAAIGARALMMHCWHVGRGTKTPAQVLAELPRDRDLANAIAGRAVQAMKEPAGPESGA
jgi:Ser/Thr protein kinase RdoA (MazF antagonist)